MLYVSHESTSRSMPATLVVIAVVLFVLSIQSISQNVHVIRSIYPLKLLLSVMWVFGVLLLLSRLLKGGITRILTPLIFFVAYWLIFGVGLAINDVNPAKVINGFYIIYFWMVMLSFALVCEPLAAARKPVHDGLILVGIICAVVSMLQTLKSAPIVLPEASNIVIWSVDFHGRYRAHAFFSSGVANGALMTISSLLVLDRIFKSDKGERRQAELLINTAMFIALCVGVYVTYTRMIYGTFAICMAIYLFMALRLTSSIVLVCTALFLFLAMQLVGEIGISDDFFSEGSLVARREIIRQLENILYYQDVPHKLFGLLAFRLNDFTYSYSVVDNAYAIVRFANGILGQIWFVALYAWMLLSAKRLFDQGCNRIVFPVLGASLFSFQFNEPVSMTFAMLTILSLVRKQPMAEGAEEAGRVVMNDACGARNQ